MPDKKDSDSELPDIFGLPPEFYRFEIINVLVLIVVGVILIVLTAIDLLHVFLGVGLIAIVIGISSIASSQNYLRTRSAGASEGVITKSFKYRLATGIISLVAGGVLLLAYAIR